MVSMREVRSLEVGDIVRFNYGIDNFIKAVVLAVEVHTTWTKVTFRDYVTNHKRTTWLYTDAGIEWIGREE